MRLKSYFADTVEAAMSLASRELGPDAMLVDSKKAPAEAAHLGAYEVIFAVENETSETVAAPAAAPASTNPEASPFWRHLTVELARIRKQVERNAAYAWSPAAETPRGAGSEAASAYGRLIELGFSTAVASDVMGAIQPARGRADVWGSVTSEVRGRLKVGGALGRSRGGRHIVALVGPAGSGKTTAALNLAIHHLIDTSRAVQLISADTHRVNGSEQLRAYAALAGIPFQTAESPSSLSRIAHEYASKDLVIIDTPGLGPNDYAVRDELASALALTPDVDVHLVLTACMKTADLTRAAARFAAFEPSRLLFTRLDETESYGSVVNEAIRSELPVSFLASGPEIPDDFHRASAELLLQHFEYGAVSTEFRFDTAAA